MFTPYTWDYIIENMLDFVTRGCTLEYNWNIGHFQNKQTSLTKVKTRTKRYLSNSGSGFGT